MAAVLAVAAGALAWRAITMERITVDATGPVQRDMNGNLVRLDPGEELTADQLERQQAEPSGLGSFVVPSVDLTVPLGSMNVVDGRIVPPSFTSAYWIANLGVGLAQAASGTVYVAMHSVQWGALAPGNFLFDVDTGRSSVPEGANIEVGGIAYAVDGSFAVPKDRIAYDSSVWADEPGRLVVVTCLTRPGGSAAVDNFVITAHLA